MKDNFSLQSDQYAQYRPAYPDELFTYIKTILSGTQNAWDCGTGNGQVAQKLAPLFTNVYATDISQAQLDQAVKKDNIFYAVQPAEQTNFPQDFFDLIVVAQAVHWFHFERFYAEVNRTAKRNALLVILGYSQLQITEALDAVITHFYHHIIGPYWDWERKYVDEQYQTIPFPFAEIKAPSFNSVYDWTLEHLVGYLQTWSAVKHYIKKEGSNPVAAVYKDLKDCWGMAETRPVRFPLLLRIGKISNF